MSNIIQSLTSFIDTSVTAFHTTETAVRMLSEAGFEPLSDAPVRPGGAYYKVRHDAAVIAFRVPERIDDLRLISAHGDSPCYKIQATPTRTSQGCTVLNVAPYGGMIHSSFVDVPLGIAGRISRLENGAVQSRLIDFKRPMAMIVNPPVHLNRDINKGKAYKPLPDLQPVLSDGETDLLALIQDTFNLPTPVIGHDLFVYSMMPVRTFGANETLISGPRLDDLVCAFAALSAIIDASSDALNMIAIFNNEEVGSLSYTGADSDFLPTLLQRIFDDMNMSARERTTCLEKSIVISADNAHAVHPNYPGLYAESDRCRVNGGPVIKYSANQRYTTDAVTAAFFAGLCQAENVPYKVYENHPNQPGGSTLGNLLNGQISIRSVDVGIAQWAMHSAYETAGTADVEMLIRVFRRYFQSHI
ncbi:MAG: M18 family aminopeptidase [Eubacteriales bacterium]|nr:M18 family aminopeptidase [Eubacteriales bacterium]